MKIPGFLAINTGLLAGVLMVGCGDKDKPAQGEAQSGEPVKTETDTSGKNVSAKSAVNINSHPGKALHASNCISCHDATMYTRKDRKVGDFTALVTQVKRCNVNLASQLLGDDIADVADYLNQAYYQYAK